MTFQSINKKAFVFYCIPNEQAIQPLKLCLDMWMLPKQN